MIALINLGNSNIQSVINALDYLNIKYLVTDNYQKILNCNQIILPGVGTFGNGMTRLNELNIVDTLRQEVLVNKKPILGICLGMQMLFDSSEESIGYNGLGLLSGNVVNLPKSKNYHIPRIGWADSKVKFNFLGLDKDQSVDFYYIHSYYVKPSNPDIIAIETESGITSAIQSENIFGCQFHPEKSHKSGLKILKAFADI